MGGLVGGLVDSKVVWIITGGSEGPNVGGTGDSVGSSSEQYLGYFVGFGVNVGRGETVGVVGALVLALPPLVGLAVIDGAGETVGDLVFLTFVGAGEDVGVGSSRQSLPLPVPLPFPPRKIFSGILGGILATCRLRRRP